MGCVLVTSFIDACEWLLFTVVNDDNDADDDDDAAAATVVVADDVRAFFSTAFELPRGGLPFAIRCVSESLSLHAIFAVC